MPALLFPEVGEYDTDNIQSTEEISFHLRPDLFIGNFFDCPNQSVAGIVDNHIDSSEVIHCLLDGKPDFSRICDVQLWTEKLGAILFYEIGKRGRIAGSGCYLIALLQQMFCQRTAQSGG